MAETELEGYRFGLGDVEEEMKYIWYAYELARDSNMKKLLKRVYDAINDGKPWKARRLLKAVTEKLTKMSCQEEEFLIFSVLFLTIQTYNVELAYNYTLLLRLSNNL